MQRWQKWNFNRGILERNSVIIGGILLNVSLCALNQWLNLPLFLDTAGTIFVACICDPLAAIITALVSSICCIPLNRVLIYFSVSNICVAIAASNLIAKKILRRRGGWLLLALALSLVSGVIGGIVVTTMNTVIRMDYDSVIYLDQAVEKSVLGRLPALILMNLLLNITDKFFVVLLGVCCAHFVPDRIRAKIDNFHRDEVNEQDIRRKHHRLLVILGVEAVALVCVCVWISVALYTSTARKERMNAAIGAAHQAVNAVDSRLVDTYLRTGYGAQSYTDVKAVLQGIRDNTPYLESVYVYRIQEDGCHVIFEASEDGQTHEPGTVVPFAADMEENLSRLLAGEDIRPVESKGLDGWMMKVYQPIRNAQGECVAYAGVDVSMQNMDEYIKDFVFRVILCSSSFLIFSLAFGLKMSANYYEIINDQYRRIEEAKEAADEANRAKSHFLANMSHEIRTPINAVLGMDEMILRECEDVNILLYAESIKTAGNTLLGLINDILDFSKIEAGKMEILPVEYDLSSVINDLVSMVESRAEKKGLQIILELDEKMPKLLYGDEIRIKQVITNILTNAVKYTEKGSVTLHMGYEKVDGEPDEIWMSVSVTDTGIGIKPEDLEKLFSEFERIEEKRNRNIEGTGLGMNITKKLLEMMGSFLVVKSVYGEGSTFSFRVKQKVVRWDELGDYEAAFQAFVAGRKKYREKFTAPDANVLVVDDTPMNLEVFRSLLKRTGVIIDTAESGDECLDFTAQKKYDLIFLDHMMPKKDGIQTLQELRAQSGNPNLGTPAVCLTANAISGAREQYLAAGFDDYLAKPIDAGRLEEMMMRYLPEDKLVITKETEAEAVTNDGEAGTAVIPEWLHAVEGLDIDGGLLHCGSAESYLDTLKIYAKNAPDSADEIEGLWNAGDLSNTTVKIHAIKSLSRAIGAESVGALAEKLEYAGKAEDADAVGAEINDLLAGIRGICKGLAPLCESKQEPEDESLPMISDDELQEAYGELIGFADSMDAQSAGYVFDFLAGYRLPKEERERVEKVRHAIETFEWEQVGEILQSGENAGK